MPQLSDGDEAASANEAAQRAARSFSGMSYREGTTFYTHIGSACAAVGLLQMGCAANRCCKRCQSTAVHVYLDRVTFEYSFVLDEGANPRTSPNKFTNSNSGM